MNSQPWMNTKEIEKILSYLGPKHIMLEWGAGGSTLFFSKKVANYYSIEHNAEWAASVGQEITKQGLKNISLFWIKPDAPLSHPSKYNELRNYIEFPVKLGVPRFDRILIDGRGRPECAKAIHPFIDRDSLVFFHDFYLRGREYYQRILGFYEVIDSVLDTSQTLAVLRKQS